MMKSRIYIVLIMLIAATSVVARPARPGIHIFTQPDGTTFEGRCHGDEFFKIKTTCDGHGIIPFQGILSTIPYILRKINEPPMVGNWTCCGEYGFMGGGWI